MANRLVTFAGGASLGFIASRILPPLLSQTVASWNTARGQDPFEYLAEDHRRFSDLLAEMEHSRGKGVFHRTQLLLRLKRGLSAHAMAEEDVIYPLIHDEVGAATAAEHLYAEHGMIKTHLYALERMMDDEAAWVDRAAVLKRLVDGHARQEEEVEFPRLRGLLDKDAIARTARHIRREKAMML